MFENLVKIGIVIGVFALYGLVMSMIIAMLWNYAMVKVFSLPTIDYLDALCLILLSRIFFDRPSFSKKSD